MVSGQVLRAEVVILLMLTGLSAVLGDALSSGSIWAVAQDQLQALKYPLKHTATLFEGPLPMEPSGHRD